MRIQKLVGFTVIAFRRGLERSATNQKAAFYYWDSRKRMERRPGQIICRVWLCMDAGYASLECQAIHDWYAGRRHPLTDSSCLIRHLVPMGAISYVIYMNDQQYT
jgi:hypothetical protein